VLPLGIVAPGADPHTHEAALADAGAVLTLKNVGELLEMLPARSTA
jgi:hypothetical protein